MRSGLGEWDMGNIIAEKEPRGNGLICAYAKRQLAGIAAAKCHESRASAGGVLKFAWWVPCEMFARYFLLRADMILLPS